MSMAMLTCIRFLGRKLIQCVRFAVYVGHTRNASVGYLCATPTGRKMFASRCTNCNVSMQTSGKPYARRLGFEFCGFGVSMVLQG